MTALLHRHILQGATLYARDSRFNQLIRIRALGSSFEADFVALTQKATPTSPPPGPQVKVRRSRAAFAAAMNRMWLAHSRGVDFTPEQVRSILGPPDEVPLPNDPAWHAGGTVWLYGTNGTPRSGR